MAQHGNDTTKEGLATKHPNTNVHDGVYAGGTNVIDVSSFVTKEDNDETVDAIPNASYAAQFALGPNHPA